jgi:hypothetical protein
LAISPPDFSHHEEQDKEQGNIYGPQVFISKGIELTTFPLAYSMHKKINKKLRGGQNKKIKKFIMYSET